MHSQEKYSYISLKLLWRLHFLGWWLHSPFGRWHGWHGEQRDRNMELGGELEGRLATRLFHPTSQSDHDHVSHLATYKHQGSELRSSLSLTASALACNLRCTFLELTALLWLLVTVTKAKNGGNTVDFYHIKPPDASLGDDARSIGIQEKSFRRRCLLNLDEPRAAWWSCLKRAIFQTRRAWKIMT